MDPKFIVGGVVGAAVGILVLRWFGPGRQAMSARNDGTRDPPLIEQDSRYDDTTLEHYADTNNLSYIPRRNANRTD